MTSSSQPDFWEPRYRAGQTPWDFGDVPAALKKYLAAHPRGGSVLVPGCGSGHEIAAFASAGYEVTAIDFAPAAVELARRHVGPALADRVLLDDFFTCDFAAAPFDSIYERTFLCALPPDQRPAYARRIAQLLKPGGALIGFFYFGKTPPDDGPPFGLAWGEADELFSRHFLIGNDQPVTDSLPIFAGKERWQERRRTRSG